VTSRFVAPCNGPSWRGKRALRETEAEQAQISARETIEKARIANEQTIAEARIASERETRQKEIERTQAVESKEIQAREEIEKGPHRQPALGRHCAHRV